MILDFLTLIIFVRNQPGIKVLRCEDIIMPIQPNDMVFPWKVLWCSKVPLRVAFFSWTVALMKILTIDNLWKKEIIMLDWCCMCKRSGESVDLLLLYCPIACEMWTMVRCLFGLQWVVPLRFTNMFAAWQGAFGRHHNIAFRRVVPPCIMWCLWSLEGTECQEF